MYGELIPQGGGDNITMKKTRLLVGRRESCDVVLRFPNVSAHHCELEMEAGYWYVTDLNSRNGVKINDARVFEKRRLDPGDTLSVAKHQFTIEYSPADLGAIGPPPIDEGAAKIFGKSLLERAGLAKRQDEDDGEDEPEQQPKHKARELKSRYDILNNDAGQVKKPGEAL
jgi:hypothetical protein